MDGVTRGNGDPKKLTDIAIRNLKAGAARREISDGKNGLFVILQPGGRKSFAVRYRFDGRPRKLTLPRGITLAAARKAAAAPSMKLSRAAIRLEPSSKLKKHNG